MLNFQQKGLDLENFSLVLKKCPLFENIDDDELKRMLVCLGSRIAEYDKKQVIFSEGSAAKYLGIMLSGTAHIEQVDYYGNRSLIDTVGNSDVFAEAFACAQVEHLPLDVVADTPSKVMLIDCSHILHTCHNNCAHHQQLIYNLMRDIAEKTIVYHQKIDVTSKRTTRDKLLAYLTHMSKKFGKKSFDIPFDRQELADYLEVDRSGLSAEISKMKADGIIDNKKNHFVLL